MDGGITGRSVWIRLDEIAARDREVGRTTALATIASASQNSEFTK